MGIQINCQILAQSRRFRHSPSVLHPWPKKFAMLTQRCYSAPLCLTKPCSSPCLAGAIYGAWPSCQRLPNVILRLHFLNGRGEGPLSPSPSPQRLDAFEVITSLHWHFRELSSSSTNIPVDGFACSYSSYPLTKCDSAVHHLLASDQPKKELRFKE